MQHHILFLDCLTIPAHIPIPKPDFPHQWQERSLTTPDELVEAAREATIIVSNKAVISAQAMEQLPKLQHIAVYATGYNNIDIEACKKHGVSVSNTRGYATTSVPEHTLSMIFALKRNLFAYKSRIENNHWQASPFFHDYCAPAQNLRDAQLGIIGGGELGLGTARLGKALGMKVVFAGRKGAAFEQRENEFGAYQPFEKVLAESDVISLHCPLTEENKNLIALPELQTMKKTALLINTARGGLVNEQDLVTAIKEKIIAGAGFDVAAVEPIADDNPLLELKSHPDFILTPHVAWMSDEALTFQAKQVIANLEAFVAGREENRVV